MLLADTLSRAPLKVTEYEVSSFEDVNHQLDLPVSDERWEQLNLASKNDPVLRDLQNQIRMGWPQSKRSLADHLTPFFGVRDQLIIQDDLIFIGAKVVKKRANGKGTRKTCRYRRDTQESKSSTILASDDSRDSGLCVKM